MNLIFWFRKLRLNLKKKSKFPLEALLDSKMSWTRTQDILYYSIRVFPNCIRKTKIKKSFWGRWPGPGHCCLTIWLLYYITLHIYRTRLGLRIDKGMRSHRVLCLGIILLWRKLLHPVRVYFHGLLFSLHQQCCGSLATALPQGIHHIGQIGDDVAWAFQHAGVLLSRNRCTSMTWRLMAKMPNMPAFKLVQYTGDMKTYLSLG